MLPSQLPAQTEVHLDDLEASPSSPHCEVPVTAAPALWGFSMLKTTLKKGDLQQFTL